MIRAAILALILVSPASANQLCAPLETVSTSLQSRYSETLQSSMRQGPVLVLTWANVETGSWTMTQTTPGGWTCIAGSGNGYEVFSTTRVERPGPDF